MSYFFFNNYISKERIEIIFELGSRDLKDALKLIKHYTKSKCYSFECNPDCLIECNKTIINLNNHEKKRIFLIKKAVSITDSKIKFHSFDLSKYNNMGASSILKIDFSKRNTSDPDYNRENVQKSIEVDGIRLDSYIKEHNIKDIDLLCIDLQGYELNAIKSLGEKIKKVKYIITECSIQSTYINGCNFIDLNKYLENNGFKYIVSNKFGTKFPDLTLKGFSEFDALFINSDYII